MDDEHKSNGKNHGQSNGHSSPHENDDTVIHFTAAKKQQEQHRKAAQKAAKKATHEPLINLPPATKFFVLVILIIHAGIVFPFGPVEHFWAMAHFGVVPAKYTGSEPFDFYAVISPLTFMFFHGGWIHVLMNTVMLMAFGTGVEKWIGARKFLIFFTICSLCAALTHFALDPHSNAPMVGASGGLSGLFAAILIMMKQRSAQQGQHIKILPFVGLWIVISIGFGMLGGSDSSQIAWAAHIGGFIAGFIFLKPVLRYS